MVTNKSRSHYVILFNKSTYIWWWLISSPGPSPRCTTVLHIILRLCVLRCWNSVKVQICKEIKIWQDWTKTCVENYIENKSLDFQASVNEGSEIKLNQSIWKPHKTASASNYFTARTNQLWESREKSAMGQRLILSWAFLLLSPWPAASEPTNISSLLGPHLKWLWVCCRTFKVNFVWRNWIKSWEWK